MRFLLTVAVCVCRIGGPGCLVTLADDTDRLNNWPEWRGPLRTGVAPFADPPIQWSEGSSCRTRNVSARTTLSVLSGRER